MGHGKMDDEVHAAGDVDAVLAGRSKELDDSRGHDGHAEAGSNATEGSAHANGAEFVEVCLILVESNEVLGDKIGLNGDRQVVVGNMVEESCKGSKVGPVASAGRGVKGELAKEVKR